jgi:2-(1,2-epoxy-1,2-dihydrophenyl)acetyl-CoA isomerase
VDGATHRTIRVSRNRDVVSVVLDRPAVLNALSAEMLGELLGVLPEIETSGARALVLSGEGRAFCSGADLTSLSDDVDLTDPGDVRRHMGRWSELILGIRKLPLPSVAAVAGPAYGGGCNLAAACDIVIAAESARFCQSYIDRGVTTDLGGSFLLARLIGWGRARRMLLTGEVVDGVTAAAIGLASEVVPDDQLADRADEMAATLAAKDPQVMEKMRRLLDEGTGGSLDEALDREGDEVAALLAELKFQNGLEAFATRSDARAKTT